MRVVTTPTQASGRFVTATHTLVMADEGACFLWDAADGHAVVPTDAASDRLWGRCRADAEWRQSVLVSDRGDGVPPRLSFVSILCTVPFRKPSKVAFVFCVVDLCVFWHRCGKWKRLAKVLEEERTAE